MTELQQIYVFPSPNRRMKDILDLNSFVYESGLDIFLTQRESFVFLKILWGMISHNGLKEDIAERCHVQKI